MAPMQNRQTTQQYPGDMEMAHLTVAIFRELRACSPTKPIPQLWREANQRAFECLDDVDRERTRREREGPGNTAA